MMNRRRFTRNVALTASMLALPAYWSVASDMQRKLPRRSIPGTDDTLPVIGLGNSNAFRQNDVEVATSLISLFHAQGGAYIDCSGDSRFVVAGVASSLGIAEDLFLGAYFSGADGPALREEIARLSRATNKKPLDLAHAYPEFAAPNWDLFRQWQEEGLARYIGVARHHASYYETMMEMMATGTVDFLQVNYSLLEPEAAEKVLPTARDKGVAVTINRPFINGEFFSRVRGHALPPWAAEFDCESWAQFSLKFILAHPAVTCVLTETANPQHARDNIGAGFGRLPDEKTRQRMLRFMQSLPG